MKNMVSVSEKYILYADDDQEDQDLLIEMFNKVDGSLQLVCVENGRKALGFLHSLKSGEDLPCLIILDINMPLMDGIETLKEIRSHDEYQDIPVCMFSTGKSAGEVAVAKEYGAIDFFKKPIDVQTLKTITSKFLNYCTSTPPKIPKADSN